MVLSFFLMILGFHPHPKPEGDARDARFKAQEVDWLEQASDILRTYPEAEEAVGNLIEDLQELDGKKVSDAAFRDLFNRVGQDIDGINFAVQMHDLERNI